MDRQLSTNKSTQRARKFSSNADDVKRFRMNAEAADRTAVHAKFVKIYKGKPEYESLPTDFKTSLKEELKREVMAARIQEGKDADSKIRMIILQRATAAYNKACAEAMDWERSGPAIYWEGDVPLEGRQNWETETDDSGNTDDDGDEAVEAIARYHPRRKDGMAIADPERKKASKPSVDNY